ncbi:uncharacterized protein LOC126841486 [Adelges cooleyi]|uniref:uncharacterized protein LOC126841486 n=1 Tax=Adelges cooleyi TaxID=133065 RepID=UPI002180645A|nr:uncharacterized protein LOC126841486 [Adelges cooleyi]
MLFDKAYSLKTLSNVVLILLSLRFSFVQSESLLDMERISCYYSRYAHYYLFLTNMVYDLTIGSFQIGSFPLDAPKQVIIDYEEILESQGYIFMAMLEDLRLTRPDYRIPPDLMKINLYLNHVSGYTRVLAKTLFPDKEPTKRVPYEIGYKMAQNQTWLEIKNNLSRCMNYRPANDRNLEWYVQDQEGPLDSPRLRQLNRLLLPKGQVLTNLKPNILQQLNENKRKFDTIFAAIFKHGGHLKFHPNNMLFRVFMSPERVSTSNAVDKSHLIQSVTVTMAEGGNDNNKSINDLFIGGTTNFSKHFVLSFQHRVTAAAIHPVFMCVSTFLTVIDRLFYAGEDKFGGVASRVAAHENTLKTHGTTLLGHFGTFVGLRLFPGLTQEYLVYMHRCFAKFVGGLGQNLHLQSDMDIPRLLRMCHRPMEVNRFRYEIKAQTLPMDTEDGVLRLVRTAKRDIDEIELYVGFLGKHRAAFEMVTDTFYHDEMFLRDPSVPRPINNSGVTNSEYKIIREDADNF